MLIQSAKNPRYQALRRLAQGRRLAGQILLEGVHLCQEWLHHHGAPDVAVFDAQRVSVTPELQALYQALPAQRVLLLEPALVKGLSQVATSQGVFFQVQVEAPELPVSLSETCLWLDRIQDPGNVGTLLRTAAAAGLRQVYLSEGCADVWSPKVLRAAQGAHFALTLYAQCALADLYPRLRIPLLATSLDDAVSLYQDPLPARCAWVMGNEGQGVDAGLLARADRRVFIPQAAAVESLNVIVAAGICLFEQRRQQGVLNAAQQL